MDKKLYEVLKKAYERKRGRDSFLLPESESGEDRKAFDRFVSALYKLRDLGFVKFRENQVLELGNDQFDGYNYGGIACEFTHDAEDALSYGSYEAYLKSLPTPAPLGINIDQSFNNFGTMQGSAIAVHSHDVNQTVREASDVEKLFQQMIATLNQDRELSETQRQELLEDVQSLKKELQRTNPRPPIVTELYSFLGNTASLASYLPQLQLMIQSFLR